MELSRHRTLRYFGCLPTRDIRDAESGSLSQCTAHFLLLSSDPAVTSNTLTIRIVFPMVGVTPAYRRPGCQPCRANKKMI